MQDLQSKFIAYLTYEKRYSHHTVTAYKKDLEQFRDYMLLHYDQLNIKEVKRTHIRSWIAGLSEQNVSARSINRKISSLSSFFKYLNRQRIIESSPMNHITKPKTERRLASFVREDKIDTVIDSVTDGSLPESIADFNSLLIVEMLYQTGIRRSELQNLTINDTNLSKNEIRVFGKGGKERIIPINDKLSSLIHSYLELRNPIAENTHNKLFVLPSGKALYPKYIYNVVNKILKNSASLKKNSPHILRHTFATHLLNEGADINAIKELLGHASLAATEIYTHNSIEKLKNVHKKSHPKS